MSVITDPFKEKFLAEIEKKVEDIGYKLVEFSQVIKKKCDLIVVVITAEEPISLRDCEIVTKEVKDYLDNESGYEKDYMLEVSSPGIGRKLKTDRELAVFKGKSVTISYLENGNIEKLDLFIDSFTKDTITFKNSNDEEITILRENIKKVILN